MYKTRILQQSDFDVVHPFLLARQFLCMHMCSNTILEGLDYSGRRFSGTYAGAFLVANSGDTNDSALAPVETLAAVVCLCWNGMVLHLCDTLDPLLQSDVVSLCVSSAKREVTGVAGSKPGCEAIVRILGLEQAETTLNEDEGLYLLNVAELMLPDKLRARDVESGANYVTRFPLESELPQIVEYRVAFQIESLGMEDTADNRATALEAAHTSHNSRRHFVIVDGNRSGSLTHTNEENSGELNSNSATPSACELYSFLGFSAVTPNCVNIGPVFTPKEFRCKGYAKRLLYGALCYARDTLNATQATLIANDPAAVSAYLSVGFKLYGQSKLILYKPKPK